jgi:hypothetical protein
MATSPPAAWWRLDVWLVGYKVWTAILLVKQRGLSCPRIWTDVAMRQDVTESPYMRRDLDELSRAYSPRREVGLIYFRVEKEILMVSG